MYRYLLAEGRNFFTTTDDPKVEALGPRDTLFRISRDLVIEYWNGENWESFEGVLYV